MSDTGIGQKLTEIGVSAAKGTVSEISTVVGSTIAQVTGSPQKSEHELQQLAQTDKTQSGARIDQIKKELAAQRFQEVSQWTPAPTTPQYHEPAGPEIPSSRGFSSMSQPGSSANQPEVVRQAVGKTEQGRNYKG
jgi:hypothetical protein